MAVHKQSVSFSEMTFAFVRELVKAGEYPNVSAAVSGELARTKLVRDREQALFEAELQRRLILPVDHWEPLTDPAAFTADARVGLAVHAGPSFDDPC